MLELDPRLPQLPDDWVVWAFSDAHGVTSGLVTALQKAGLIDGQGRWVAAPRTALVGCGDYIDRGRDVAGMVALLRRLQVEAAAAGGAVVPARGNHEVMLLMAAKGAPEWLETWLEYGGEATVAAYGCAAHDPTDPTDLADPADPEQLLGCLDRRAAGLLAWMASLPQAVRWRDVLFVHGGLAPGHGPDDLGVTTDEHLWVRSGFFDTPWGSGAFDAYEAAGIERVVFGHTPQWNGPTRYHEGRSLAIDTNAVGNPAMPAGAVQALTLVGFAGSGGDRFDEATIISIDTHDAPDRMRATASE